MENMPQLSGTTLPRADNVPLAVSAIILTVLALSLGDALIKGISGSGFVIWQIFVVRSALAVPVLLMVIQAFSKCAPILPKRSGWTAIRSLMLVLMWLAYYFSLPHLQLSVAAAAYYTLPMFITLFSAVLAGERVGRVGWMAVGLGFLGVLLILRPAADAFNAYVLLPLVAAMLYALAMILTRTKCREEHPLTLSLALNFGFILFGGVATLLIGAVDGFSEEGFLLAPWTPMGPEEWQTMAILSLAILVGSLGAAIAYQNAPSGIVGTFDFGYVGFAVIWGLMFFGEVPDMLSFAGMVMIVTAGVTSMRQRTR
ncbi:MAG TPA: DMT family transporter [Aestuariivirgaceae bacterium]|nr:DMT family transporter [Aestuariivirgaceae bacterium]